MIQSDRRGLADLGSVTLVAVSSVAIPATIRALEASMRQARFSRVLFLSDSPLPLGADPAIEWKQIAPLSSRADFSRFMIRELADHIETEHALCVQWDGYVLNGDAWDPAFLDFDYIGAVWPQFSDGQNVGNGGFSLRSKRLIEACRNLPFDDSVAEDVLICRSQRARLEQSGLSFAPESVARRFSFERSARTGEEFGFHGCLNLLRLVTPVEAYQIVRSLEPQMLSPRERRELFSWALTRGHFKIAARLLARLIH